MISSDGLRKAKEGDEVSATQWNLMRRGVQSRVMQPNSMNSIDFSAQRSTIASGQYVRFNGEGQIFYEGTCIELYEAVTDDPVNELPLYKGRLYDGTDTSPEKLIGIVEAGNVAAEESGTAWIEGICKNVQVDGTPRHGGSVGPKHGEVNLQANEPGFTYLGASEDGHSVRRVFSHPFGYGTTVAGQTGTPATINLEAVVFQSGLQAWDGTSDFLVDNVHDDEVCDGLRTAFMWNPSTDSWVVTTISCC